MNTYIAIFVIALFASLVLTPIIRRLSARIGWLDKPLDDRRVHHQAIPRVGGIAILLSVLIALLALPLVDNLVTQSLLRDRWQLLTVFIPALLVTLLGLYDDVRGAIRGRVEVMAPHWYVLCATSPPDESHAAWRSQPSLAAGSGRSGPPPPPR